MRGPLVDIVLLALVVVFLGLEQRRRPELYFRFWTAGWLMVLFSIVCWTFEYPAWVPPVLLECVRQDALVFGGIAFLFSFSVSGRKIAVSIWSGLALGGVICLELDWIAAGSEPRLWMVLLVVFGEMLSLAMAYGFLVRGRRWCFPLMTLVCTGCGSGMVYTGTHGRKDEVMNFALAQIFLSCGLMIGRSKYRGGRFAGAVGFGGWGLCYLLATEMFAPPAVMRAVYAGWTIPKYLVGFGMILQILRRSQMEVERLNAQHQRMYEEYRVLFQGNPHPMWIYDVATLRFVSVNDAAVRAYGYGEAEFSEMTVLEIVAEGAECSIAEKGVAKRTGRHRLACGTTFDVDLTEQDIMFAGEPARLVLAVDITEREELNRELIRRAHHDALTGLPNRIMLEDRIAQCLSRCDRELDKGALLTVDIDHFKRVNDTYGHQAGDECLKETADRLRSRVRSMDTIARTGGEEFTIVVGGLADRGGAETVCAELLKMFEAPFSIAEEKVRVTVSIGAAVYPDDAKNIDGLRRISDQALYEAKRLGRNQAAFASALAREMTQVHAEVGQVAVSG